MTLIHSTTLSWVGYSLELAGFLSLCLVVLSSVKTLSKHGYLNLKVSLPTWKLNNESSTILPLRFSDSIPKLAFVLTLVCSLVSYRLGYKHGYTARELEQYHHTYILNDIQILRRDAYNMYYASLENNQPFEIKFCDDYIPDFDERTILKTLVYEDRGACKSISDKKLGYIVARINGVPVKTRR